MQRTPHPLEELVTEAEHKAIDETNIAGAITMVKRVLLQIENPTTLDEAVLKVRCLFINSYELFRNIKKSQRALLSLYEEIYQILVKMEPVFEKSSRTYEYFARMSNLYNARAVAYFFLAGKGESLEELEYLKLSIKDNVLGFKICKDHQDSYMQSFDNLIVHFKLPLMLNSVRTIDAWHTQAQAVIDEKIKKIIQFSQLHVAIAKLKALTDEFQQLSHSAEKKHPEINMEALHLTLENFYDTALAKIKEDKYEEASTILQVGIAKSESLKILKSKIKKAEASILLAHCYKMLKQPEDMIKRYRSAIDQFNNLKGQTTPWHSYLWLLHLECGLAYLRIKNIKTALKEFKYARLNPDYFKNNGIFPLEEPNLIFVEIAILLNDEAEAFLKEKKYREVIETLLTLVEINISPYKIQFSTYEMLIIALTHLGETQKANEYLSKISPADDSALSSLKAELKKIKMQLTQKKVPAFKNDTITPSPTESHTNIIKEKESPEALRLAMERDEKAQRNSLLLKSKKAAEKQQKAAAARSQKIEEAAQYEKKKIAEVRLRAANKKAVSQAKKKQRDIPISDGFVAKKIKKHTPFLANKKMRQKAKREQRELRKLLKTDEFEKRIKEKKPLRKEKIITEYKKQVIVNKAEILPISAVKFDKKSIEEKIRHEARAVVTVTKNIEKGALIPKNMPGLNKNILVKLGIHDIALVLRVDMLQTQQMIAANPFLKTLLRLDQCLRHDPLLEPYNLRLRFQGTAIFVFIISYYKGIKTNFNVNDLDIFIEKVPYASENNSAKIANLRLESILEESGFNCYHTKAHFANYQKNGIQIELTLCRRNYKSNNPFPFTDASAFFTESGGIEFVDENKILAKIASTNVVDCILINKDTQFISQYFTRLLKYYEKILSSPYFVLGCNFKSALSSEWQLDFFMQKFRQSDPFTIDARHFNYLELASVIKNNQLNPNASFAGTFHCAVRFVNSFCEALYLCYLEKNGGRYLHAFSKKMADILIAYYQKYPTAVDRLYSITLTLVKASGDTLKKSVIHWVSELHSEMTPGIRTTHWKSSMTLIGSFSKPSYPEAIEYKQDRRDVRLK